MQEITKQQAAQIIDQAISQLAVTRQTHAELQYALSVLAAEPEADTATAAAKKKEQGTEGK